MRLTIPAAAALALAAVALLAACDPQDGSAPASNSARQSTPAPAANSAGPMGPAAPAKPATPAAAATPGDGIRRVNIAESRALAERGEAIIYDVRDQRAYETNRVKGSKLVPLDEFAARAAEFPKDKLIITYCA